MKILFLLLSLISFATHAQPKWAEGKILVSPKAGLPVVEFTEIIKGHGAKGARKIGQSNLYIVETFHGSERSIVARLKNNPHLKFAELDMIAEPVLAVNDPYYGSAWHLPKIGTPAAWDTTQGSGVTVAILDSGVDPSHPDLLPQLVPGWNFYENNSNTSDVYGHGTKVAGTVAAVANNGQGVAGVAGQAKIMPIRVSGSNGYATWSALSSGFIYAADLGDPGWDQYYGWGRVDAAKAVQTAISSTPTPTPTPVTVSITSPQTGATVSGLVNVDTSVSGASRVDLMVNRTVVASDTASPYSFVWDSTGVINGQNTLTAVAYDSSGSSKSSSPVTVNVSNAVAGPVLDTTPPTVVIVNPVDGKVSGNVVITVNAADDSPASGIKLQIYVDGAVIASGTGSTLSATWNTNPKKVATGQHVIKAVARDAAGNAAEASVTVTK